MTEPLVNEATRLTDGTVIIPTYVRPSEAPLADGSCVTGVLIKNPAGWYVEFRYAGDNEQHRGFFAFDAVDGPAHDEDDHRFNSAFCGKCGGACQMENA